MGARLFQLRLQCRPPYRSYEALDALVANEHMVLRRRIRCCSTCRGALLVIVAYVGCVKKNVLRQRLEMLKATATLALRIHYYLVASVCLKLDTTLAPSLLHQAV